LQSRSRRRFDGIVSYDAGEGEEYGTLTSAVVAAAIIITCGAAVCQSLTGFGFALVMLPLLSLVWDVKSAVVTTSVLSTISLLPLTLQARRHVRLATTMPMLAGSLVGTPIGLWILEWIDAEALKIFVGVVVICASVIAYEVRQVKATRRRVVPAAVAGVLSGVLGGSTSMGGPPAVFYVQGTERSVEIFRGTLLSFFLLAGLYRVGGFAVVGRVTSEVAAISAITLPAMAVGLLAGFWLRPRVREETFRLLVLLILILTSLAVIISASRDLI
jgi:uncharacterized membrane protein YfcA